MNIVLACPIPFCLLIPLCPLGEHPSSSSAHCSLGFQCECLSSSSAQSPLCHKLLSLNQYYLSLLWFMVVIIYILTLLIFSGFRLNPTYSINAQCPLILLGEHISPTSAQTFLGLVLNLPSSTIAQGILSPVGNQTSPTSTHFPLNFVDGHTGITRAPYPQSPRQPRSISEFCESQSG